MFPSENVWKGIDRALHTRRRWYGLGLTLLLLLTGGGVTLVMLTTPVNKGQISQQTEANTVATNQTLVEEKIPTIDDLRSQLPNGPIEFNKSLKKQSQPANAVPFLSILTEPGNEHQDLFLHSPEDRENSGPSRVGLTMQHTTVESKLIAPIQPATGLILPSAIMVPERLFSETLGQESDSKPGIAEEAASSDRELGYPLTIESVLNSFSRARPKKGISLQVYISPTVSYRKLSENKTFMQSAASSGIVPASVAYRDVNNAVTHKPDVGLEIGLSAKYPLSKALQVKAGLQFNVSRYDIRAFYNPGEIATIALDAGAGSNSISQATIYRNYNGSRTNWLQNLYYSASIPVGAEWRFPSRKPTYFAVAATVQPTYIISDRAYLLSTDYKNYVEIPSLIRRWNMNTGFEAMVGYSTNRAQWQIGPQVRYQVRSSFVDQYPLKENLFDFGLKVGVIFNK
ncbi:MAG TPA: outer membrane beta-barrel protein [Chitinophagaceae bacterium]|nr:outer membrane beta-barrel protein [Chitinophagaceae bacterium]